VREVDIELMDHPPVTVGRFFTYPLSTITSPAFSEVTVLYRHNDFRGLAFQYEGLSRVFPKLSQAKAKKSLQHRRFEVFQTMHKARHFQLVLCADVRDDNARESLVYMLKHAIAKEEAE